MSNVTLGVDMGSTTIKLVAIKNEEVIYKVYERHHSKINETLSRLISDFLSECNEEEVYFNITGSAGLGLSKKFGMNFIQEVSCAFYAVNKLYDDVSVIIELGGEDAKVIFIDNGNIEQRMNGTCAGGTGAFIDQMAQLIKVDVSQMNELASNANKIYDISSRCGVFAKNDIQPLLNQGATKEDVAISVYQAIVNQTIIGLAQGREIKGKVCYLGGPLTFSSQLRKRFDETLNLTESFIPENSELFVAYGCAIYDTEQKLNLKDLLQGLENIKADDSQKFLDPLFKDEEDYQQFLKRHDHNIEVKDIKSYKGDAYLGIDAGSTTTKMVLISQDDKLLYEYYGNNEGNPLDIVKKELLNIYRLNSDIEIKGAYSTGYGEQLIKNAFKLDGGQVETICHYEAAKHFLPEVEFVLDIGGQDMKYFTIDNGVITSIVLNEACSSGCGSFISTYASSLGHNVKDFAVMAKNAKRPIDLGTRCTVFMNSGIKQALAMQVSIEDISASLAISVVKNALYKVIRATDFKENFGTKVLVQGGTFYNDAILKAFEDEIGFEVIRPKIAGLMGAYGAALIAKEQNLASSSIISYESLKDFVYKASNVTCKLCPNHCSLTVSKFSTGENFIANNKCSKPLKKKTTSSNLANMYTFKNELLQSYIDNQKDYDSVIGIPRGLNMYENIPFWIGFFNQLNTKVIVSDKTSMNLIKKGQHTIPSDTVCYPAKIIHGHIINLQDKGIKNIFYPNMPYNENESCNLQNHYNCPVVGCYPELIKANLDLSKHNYFMPYITLDNKKAFIKVMEQSLKELGFSKKDIKIAYDKAKEKQNMYRNEVFVEGEAVINDVITNNKNALVLAGRPYHIDEEINHGIDKLINDLGCVVLSEDSFRLDDTKKTNVLNQWTYHNRMYNAAHSIAKYDNINLVQLVSFGCGIDAITSDEVKNILSESNKLYTQIKIDDISNVGSANIRLRSLINVMGE
ncbi:acyl-CoA dehydratase activase [Mycoplasma sp. P36-A1]|uniref:acyl-CoA dehydratase activase n=1 Tax=Mycoplasma sp. P36-A1 TaxID=3252900 RepID=UPI003C2D603B